MKMLRLAALCLLLGMLTGCCVPYGYYGVRDGGYHRHYEYRGYYGHPYGNPYHSYRYYRHSGGQGYPYYP